MAEWGGRTTGLTDGRSGEHHQFDVENGAVLSNAIVAANATNGIGAALASQLDGDDRVPIVFHGEGATNQGMSHEAMNMAAIWDLPVVFVCENNGYAVSTAQEYATDVENLGERAAGYGMPAETIDGQDLLTVYEVVNDAVAAARDGDGPTFLECETYRYSGHYSAEDALLGDNPYRTDEEINEWRENRDPIDQFEAKLLDAGVLDEDDVKRIAAEVEATVEDAVAFMRDSDQPDADRALENVYADQSYPNVPAPRYR